MSHIRPAIGVHPAARALLLSVSTMALAPMAAPAAAQAPGSAAEIVLDPISVSANLVPTPLDRVGSAVTVITGEELRQRGNRLVSDVLREVPGLAVGRGGPVGQQTQLRIRGSEANHTLVLIDGVRANDPSGSSEFDFAHLLAADIERIEVLRGPQSALYGSDAIGGVVNIITRRGEGKPRIGVSIEGGSYGTITGNASLSGGGERYHYMVGGSGFRTGGVSAADKRLGNPERDGYQNATGFAKFGISPSDLVDLNIVARKTAFRTDLDGFIGGRGAVDAPDDATGDQFYGRAEGRLKLLDGRWDHIFGAAYTEHTNDNRTRKVVNSTFEGTVRRFDYQTNLRLDTPGFADGHHVLTFAAQHQQDGVVARSAFADLDRRIESTGLVGQYQGSFFDRLSVTGSIRQDFNDLFEDAFTYRITGAWRFHETGTKLRGSYGTGVKNPSMFELYGFTQTYRGNPNLSPEKARGFDIGIDQELWGSRLTADATYFNQRITDLITGSAATSINLPGTSRIHGIELGLTAGLWAGLSVRAAYTYTHGEDSAGVDLIRRPRNIASLNINYALPDERTNLNLGIIYNGRQTDYAFDAFFNQSIVTLDAYTLVNAGASYRLTDNVQAFARVENLLDKKYQEVFTYGSTGRAGYLGMRGSF